MAKKSAFRRGMNKAKRMMAKRKKSRAKKNMDTYFLRTRVTGSVIPAQGGTVVNYISAYWQLLNPTSVVGVTQSSEYKLFANIYDRVRINRITVKLVPKANTLSQPEAQNDSALNVTGDGKVHTVVLRDTESYQASVARMIRQPSYKAYSVLKPITRSYSIKYPTGVWLDAQSVYSDETLLDRLGAYGGVGIYAENVLEDNLEFFNEPWASLELIYDCVFQGKISSNLSLNDDGSICVSVPKDTTVPFSPVVAISGTFTDTRVTGFDASGAIVEVTKDDSSAP